MSGHGHRSGIHNMAKIEKLMSQAAVCLNSESAVNIRNEVREQRFSLVAGGRKKDEKKRRRLSANTHSV